MIATAFVRYLVGFGLVVTALLGGWWSLKSHYYNQGWSAALHAIAAQNEKAKKEADDARSEVEACFNSGGDWDVTSDRCLHK